MTSRSRRLLPVSVALVSLLAAVTGTSLVAPAEAATTKVAYTCESPSLNGNKLNISFTVTPSPAKIYVGKTTTPKLVVKAIIPGNIVALAAFFGVKSASATGTFSFKVGSATAARPFVFPRTDIPQTNKDFPVTINVGLAALKPTKVGSIAYKPGPVAITLTGYKNFKKDAAAGDDVGSVDANCSANKPNVAAATIAFVKSATAIGAPLTYTKSSKSVASAINVVASSGVTPYGKVTSVLYKGTKKLKSVTRTLSAGKVTTVFTGVSKKGAYKVVTTYSGSGAHSPSKKTKTFTVS